MSPFLVCFFYIKKYNKISKEKNDERYDEISMLYEVKRGRILC